VHEGFLKIANQMGGVDGSVTKSVSAALKANEGYSRSFPVYGCYLQRTDGLTSSLGLADLVLTGHSLGAGVTAVSPLDASFLVLLML
jgi:hypothetical protein